MTSVCIGAQIRGAHRSDLNRVLELGESICVTVAKLGGFGIGALIGFVIRSNLEALTILANSRIDSE
jgi:hypothetical protein